MSWSKKYQEGYWEAHVVRHFNECVLDKLQKEKTCRCIVKTHCWVGDKVVENKNHYLPKPKGCHKVEYLCEAVSNAFGTLPPSIQSSYWFIFIPYLFYVVVVFQFALHYYNLIEKCRWLNQVCAGGGLHEGNDKANSNWGQKVIFWQKNG